MKANTDQLSVSKQELRILADSDCEAAWIGEALLDGVQRQEQGNVPTPAD